MTKEKHQEFKEFEKRYFGQIWKRRKQQGSRFWQDNGFSFRYCQQMALHTLGDMTGKKVLVLGVGLGHDSAIFLEHGATVFGIDLTEEAFKAQNLQDMIGAVADAEQLCFQDESFDLVYIQNVMMLLDKEKVARDVYRSLKPNGYFLLVEPLECFFSMGKIRKLYDKNFEQAYADEHYVEVQSEQFNNNHVHRYTELFGQLTYINEKYITPLFHLMRMVGAKRLIPLLQPIEERILKVFFQLTPDTLKINKKITVLSCIFQKTTYDAKHI